MDPGPLTGGSHRIDDYGRYFTKLARRLKSNIFGDLVNYFGTHHLYLAGGLPNSETFPFVDAQIQLRNGQTVDITEDEMQVALQYGNNRGMLQLREWLTELQRRLHDPPTLPPPGVSPSANSDMITITTNGCTEAISKIMQLVLEEGGLGAGRGGNVF
ncbi:kynurenine/alpha-aminoadipate aminotransferase, mitochondrial-like [Haliotis rubra]|uniref:kynurenine/alpha-aminoadipate aminotransferase, mitochondrial-like n=1 Tax=Haliotis rubra TaxID=36100 RepID=UPI001EE5D681|nr:kynurenine/alpha-aminoadipate aminotransferase, mitochondrial-like [Haliotis rubra]